MDKKLTKSEAIKRFWRKNWMGYAFLAPFVILFTIFVVAPVVTAIGLSFTNYNMMQTPQFVGLTNYRLLFLDDEVFMIGLANTLKFAIITGPVGYLLSFFAAWVINQLKFKRAFALAFYAPSICSGIAMSTVWMVIFSSDRMGYLNNILLNMGLIDEPILWNTDPNYIMGVVMFISLWMSMGTGFLVFLAGLQNVSKSYYEAASLDGATKIQQFFHITLPMVSPTLFSVLIMRLMASMKIYDLIYMMADETNPALTDMQSLMYLFYRSSFVAGERGYGSAIVVWTVSLILLVTLIQFWGQKKWVTYDI